LSSWQKMKLQKLRAHEFKEKNLARVPKGSVQPQDEDNVQVKDVTEAQEKRRASMRISTQRFAPNHQSYWSLHHPYSLPMPQMRLAWSTSSTIFGHSSYSYFDPWTLHAPYIK
ncbi:hypothetical protein BAE44_0009874, partial [Dichanthelium oligosanthes]